MSEDRDLDLTAAQTEEIRQDFIKMDRRDRIDALRAIWRPKAAPQRADRGEEFTWLRALKLSLAILTLRRWRDADSAKYSKRHRHYYGTEIAFWSAQKTYCGYNVMCVELRPGARYSIYSDGESFL